MGAPAGSPARREGNTLQRVDRPLCLLINPSAGGGRAARAAPVAERCLRERGLTVRAQVTRDLEHARQLARDAAAAGEAVVVLGGDGMIGAAADAMRGVSGALLGIVPGGRGNDLARVLGIPSDTEAACAVVAAGEVRPIDLGEIGGRAFVGIASVGFDSDANRIANEAPSWLGGLVYAYGALRALIGWRPVHFEVLLDPDAGAEAGADAEADAEGRPAGTPIEFTGYTVAAANSKAYGGGMFAAPGAELDDGLLDIVYLEDVSKLRFIARLMPKVFKGAHVEEPSVHVERAAEVLISAQRPFTVYADGDPIGRLPLRVRALPAAIDVLAPREPGR